MAARYSDIAYIVPTPAGAVIDTFCGTEVFTACTDAVTVGTAGVGPPTKVSRITKLFAIVELMSSVDRFKFGVSAEG
jgi:hypothetical protein